MRQKHKPTAREAIMPLVRVIQCTCVCLFVTAAAASCTIPGIRPEGRTASISAQAPAARADVQTRAREWFSRNGYTLSRDIPGSAMRGHRTIATEGEVQTRAVVDFTITSSTAETTSYRVSSHSEQGRPPVFERIDQNAPEAGAAVPSLVDYLSCPTARWPRCP